jgi:hypothetical protein
MAGAGRGGARGKSGRAGCGGGGRQSGRAGLGQGADLVAGDGFLFQQGGGELVEGLSVLGEQVAGSGFRAGQQVGDFLVDEPLGNISTKPEPDTEKKGTWASPATARASRVLPVPGGPAISTPCGPRAPARW